MDNLYRRYLKLLDVKFGRQDMATLRRIFRAQVNRIPFENLSKVYYKSQQGRMTIPDFAQFLDGIERFHFGGTCYSNNYYLYLLLDYLGYDIRLCGADMSEPDGHMVSIATFEGREYLLDVGYAAPFLEPLPRDLDQPYEIVSGTNRYVLQPQDANGNSHLQLIQNEIEIHGYSQTNDQIH